MDRQQGEKYSPLTKELNHESNRSKYTVQYMKQNLWKKAVNIKGIFLLFFNFPKEKCNVMQMIRHAEMMMMVAVASERFELFPIIASEIPHQNHRDPAFLMVLDLPLCVERTTGQFH